MLNDAVHPSLRVTYLFVDVSRSWEDAVSRTSCSISPASMSPQGIVTASSHRRQKRRDFRCGKKIATALEARNRDLDRPATSGTPKDRCGIGFCDHAAAAMIGASPAKYTSSGVA